MLTEEQVSSKAMRRKLARGTALAPAAEDSLQAPPQQPQPDAPGGSSPSFAQFMVSNMVMGAGMTLGFLLVAVLARAVFGGGGAPRAPPPRSLPQAQEQAFHRDDPFDKSPRRETEVRI